LSLLAAALVALAPVEFPMSSTGSLGAFHFFETDIEHYIYSEIQASINTLRIGAFEWRLGLAIDTYMGRSWNNPEMKFNIYGGHWNITTEFAWRTDWGRMRLYTDHECFHNIDMEDTLSEYMNNVKLGAVLDPVPAAPADGFEPLPAGMPSGWLSFGLYRPRGESFQKGHDFDWSIQAAADMPLAAWNRWTGGVRYRPELFFHTDGDRSSRHSAEIYGRYDPGPGSFEVHLTHWLHDTQPFRQLDGETCAGIRFIW
jgi:hypothetical protein